jgi:hypothetical protein
VFAGWHRDNQRVIAPGGFIACGETAGQLVPLMTSLRTPVSGEQPLRNLGIVTGL